MPGKLMPIKLKCQFCKTVGSKDRPFHIGREDTDDGEERYKAICPQCTNIWYPFVATAIQKGGKKILRHVVWEDDIAQYCRDNFDSYLMEMKGKIPDVRKCMDVQKALNEIPKRFHDRALRKV